MPRPLRLSLCCLLLLVPLGGCGKKEATVSNNLPPETNDSPFLAGLDIRLLSFPDGWKKFKNDVQNAQVKIGIEKKPLTESELADLVQRARSFEKSEKRGHAHDVGLIPQSLVLCAQSAALAGNEQHALELLVEAEKIGIVEKDWLNSKAFDRLRDNEEFQSVRAVELSFAYGRFLIRKPLFSLRELLSAKSEPAMPGLADVEGKVVVIFTGPQLTPDSSKTLKEAVKAGASVHAIVAEESGVRNPSISVHVSKLSPESLQFDNTAIIWFANKDGQVVAFLRPFSGEGMATAIVKRLASL